ncbi:MAG: PKD domain-containing protein [Bacteroidota bacterium]
MKAGRLFYFLLLFLSAPLALFSQSADVTEGCAPLEVRFTPPVGAAGFFWNFGDGGSSTQANAERIYIAPGTYTVEFRESPTGPVAGTITISVYEAPTLMITADPQGGCAPLEVSFGDSSTVDPRIAIAGFQWVFGDGSPPETVQNPTHIYTQSDTFDVSLQIISNLPNCSETLIIEDFVTATDQPDVNFSTDPAVAVACEPPLSVSFTNESSTAEPLTFEWDFGNGNTSTLPNPPGAQVYTVDGFYTVSLTGTNSAGCSRTVEQIIAVGNPLASFEIADTVCAGELIQMINNSSNGNYSWNFGPDAFPETSTMRNPIVRFNEEGIYNITLTVTSADGLCSSDTTISVFADVVDPEFTAVPDYSCSEPFTVQFTPNENSVGTTYEWEFGDINNSTSMMRTPTFTYENFDTTIYSMNGLIEFEVQLTVTTAVGCVATFLDTVRLNQPNALFMPDLVDGCAPLTVEFSDSSSSNEDIISWQWIYGTAGTNTFTNGNPHSFTFNDPGEYDVILIIENAGGCRDTSYAVTIEVGVPIVPDFQADQTTICPGDTVFFESLVNDPRIEEWHFDTDDRRSFHCFNEDSLMWGFATETGTFDATLTVGYNGCYESTTMTDMITVNGPIARIEYMVNCDTPFDIMFGDSSMDATSVTWDLGDSTILMSALDTFTHTYDTTGVFTVILTAENATSGCPASIDSVEVHVRDIQADFFIGDSEVDTLLCIGEHPINAGATIDVENSCWRGFTYFFEDGRPITTQDVEIDKNFSTPGRQMIILEAMDINGCTDRDTHYIEIFTVTTIFEADKNRICLPSTVMFTDSSFADTTIMDYMWTFNDGGMSTSPNTTYTFTTTDTNFVTATLLVTDILGCGGSQTIEIPVYEPMSMVEATPNPICEGEQVSFTATDFTQEGSFLTYEWNFGNGLTSTQQINTVTYPDPGMFDVTLIFTEDSTGCQNDTMITVDVQEFPDASFESGLDGQDFICFNEQAIFTSNTSSQSPLDYQWFVNGTPQGSNAPQFSASLGRGTFEIKMLASTSAGCLDSFSNSYTLIQPDGDFDITPTEICVGESIFLSLRDTVDVTSFSWQIEGYSALIDDQDSITLVIDRDSLPVGATQIRVDLLLRGENDDCEFTVSKFFSVQDVLADFAINDDVISDTVSVCINEPVNFSNFSTGADIFDWDFGEGGIASTSDPSYTYTTPGVFQIELIAENQPLGCMDTLQRAIRVVQIEAPEIVFDELICADTTTQLLITNYDPTTDYIWRPDSLIITTTPDGNTLITTTDTITSNTTFTLTQIERDLGCTNTASIDIQVIRPLPGFLGADTVVCPGETIALPIQNDEFHTFTWSTTDGLSCPDGGFNCSFPTVSEIQDPIVYEVTITDQLGCTTERDTFSIDVISDSPRLPNAFTPDADGNNDFFNVVLPGSIIQDVTFNKFQVFNRWGTLIYDNDNPIRGWDGMYNGELAPSDVYVYVIEYSVLGCPTVQRVGDVTLIR